MSEVVTDAAPAMVTLNLDELRELILQVIREQLPALLEEWGFYAEPTVIEPGSPIHDDLVEILKMAEAGTLQILTREEAFGD